MKFIYTLILFVSLLSTSAGQNPGAAKTLVKSFNLLNNQIVELQLDGDVTVQEWSNPTMRIQISVTLPDGSDAMLKSLVQAGRYNLKGATSTATYRVTAPNLQKEITIGGQPLRERLAFLVYAPAEVMVKLADSTTADVLNSAESF